MSSEFKEAENPDDAEEFKDISILDMRDMLLEEEVCVEANSGNIVDDIDRGLEEVAFVRTGNKPERKMVIIRLLCGGLGGGQEKDNVLIGINSILGILGRYTTQVVTALVCK